MRLAILSKCHAMLEPHPERLAGLRRRLTGDLELPDDPRTKEEVAESLQGLEQITAQISSEQTEENISENSRRELGHDGYLFGQTKNQMMGKAHQARQQGELDLAVDLADEVYRHCQQTRGANDEITMNVKRQLALWLLESGDLLRARALLIELLEHWLQEAGERDWRVSQDAWLLFQSYRESEKRQSGAILRHYLLWLLEERPQDLGQFQRDLLPSIREARFRYEGTVA